MQLKHNILSLAAASILFIGCGSGGGDSSTTSPQTDSSTKQTGIFIDAPVEGVEYSCGSYNGTTNSSGEFFYNTDDNCSFTLGELRLNASSDKLDDNFITLHELTDDSESAAVLAAIIQSAAQNVSDTAIKLDETKVKMIKNIDLNQASGDADVSEAFSDTDFQLIQISDAKAHYEKFVSSSGTLTEAALAFAQKVASETVSNASSSTTTLENKSDSNGTQNSSTTCTYNNKSLNGQTLEILQRDSDWNAVYSLDIEFDANGGYKATTEDLVNGSKESFSGSCTGEQKTISLSYDSNKFITLTASEETLDLHIPVIYKSYEGGTLQNTMELEVQNFSGLSQDIDSGTASSEDSTQTATWGGLNIVGTWSVYANSSSTLIAKYTFNSDGSAHAYSSITDWVSGYGWKTLDSDTLEIQDPNFPEVQYAYTVTGSSGTDTLNVKYTGSDRETGTVGVTMLMRFEKE